MYYNGFQFYGSMYQGRPDETFCQIYRAEDEQRMNLLDSFVLRKGVDVPDFKEKTMTKFVKDYIQKNYRRLLDSVGEDKVVVNHAKLKDLWAEHIVSLQENGASNDDAVDFLRGLYGGIKILTLESTGKYRQADVVLEKDALIRLVSVYVEGMRKRSVDDWQISDTLLECVGRKQLLRLGFQEFAQQKKKTVADVIEVATKACEETNKDLVGKSEIVFEK